MLYDMVHSVFGKITFCTAIICVAYVALYLILCFVHRLFCEIYDLSGLRKLLVKQGHVNVIHTYLLAGGISICVISYVVFLFKEWRVKSQEYEYETIDMAEQKEIEILFESEYAEVKDEPNFVEFMQKLHVSDADPMSEISMDKIEERRNVFVRIYQTGEEKSQIDESLDLQVRQTLERLQKEVTSKKATTIIEYEAEFKMWDNLYVLQKRPLYLYQSGRSAKDIVEKGHSHMELEALLRMSAEAVYRGESFLQYDDRNIATKEKPIVMEVQDIAFINGKIYYQLYEESKIRKELKAYDKEFLVNAYVCMLIAEENITEQEYDYAKINYYIGNLGQKMLFEISSESILYTQIGKCSYDHYCVALDLITLSNQYNREDNMEKNIKKGIRTICTLLNFDM